MSDKAAKGPRPTSMIRLCAFKPSVKTPRGAYETVAMLQNIYVVGSRQSLSRATDVLESRKVIFVM
jgi:hypothetical protein